MSRGWESSTKILAVELIPLMTGITLIYTDQNSESISDHAASGLLLEPRLIFGARTLAGGLEAKQV
jgi:hypothetical protein